MGKEFLNIIHDYLAGEGFGDVQKIIISGPMRAACQYIKITALLVTVKGKEALQFSAYTQNKVFHQNLKTLDQAAALLNDLAGEGYKQWEIEGASRSFKIIVNKKGNFKVLEGAPMENKPMDAAHNRRKNYAFEEGKPLEMLVHMGLMNQEGKVFQHKQKKFRQINKFVEIAGTVSRYVPENAHILDFGCGKSYLTFALYYYYNHVLHKNVSITGLDLKSDVVADCNKLARQCGFDKLEFYCGDVSRFQEAKNCQMMVTLHACDTATDYALGYAAAHHVPVILSVPCCQHELLDQVQSDTLKPVLKHGILKERFSSILTDAARGQLLESIGYRVQIMEFIDMEHTAKNIMIKAIKTQKGIDRKKLAEYEKMAAEYAISPTLYNLLKGDFDEGEL